MRCIIPLLAATIAMSTGQTFAQPANLRPVPLADVRVEPASFWGTRLRVNREKTLPHNLKMLEETGRITNFATAAEKGAGASPGTFQGKFFFNDSDVYKVLEGAACIYAANPDSQLDSRMDSIIAQIAAAQQPDGYLYTFYTVRNELDKRWTNEKDNHETYCAGHLIEAAVAHHRATGKRNFLDIAIKLANHIDSIFGPGKKRDAPGHEEIELALVKLYDVTKDDRYLKLAQFFLEQRGYTDGRASSKDYDQDHKPVREQREIVGHAVRAMYLYSGVIDVARASGDMTLVQSMDSLWHDAVDRKMYVTGGIGPSAKNEGFTHPYDLPNESAYCETCASIGMAFWNQRLALLYGDAKYADLVEREMYNGILAGVSLDGEKFFYVNPLASKGKHHRQPWFDCACCPPNVLRFIASIGEYAYATGGNGSIYVNQYIAGTAKIGDVSIDQETDYPWDENILLTIRPKTPKQFALRLRIPGWCEEGAAVAINGKEVTGAKQHGYLVLDREWKDGDTVELHLPMPVRRVYADPSVSADVGRVALMRGPIVYCVEGADNPEGISNLLLTRDAKIEIEERKDLLGGVTVLKGEAKRVASADPSTDKPATFTAIPYFAWDNREPGGMIVWLAEDRAVTGR